MKRIRSGLLLVVLALPGCGGAKTVEQDLDTLKGRQIQTALTKFGPAKSQQPTTAAGAVYSWTVEADVNVPVKTTVVEYSAGRPNTTDVTVFRMETQSCTLRLTADAAGVINSVERDGPSGACAVFARKLS